jgi:UDP-glucose 4-epimerase
MRILVTGGAGYIGSITVRTLLNAGHDVVVLDTLENGHAAAVDPRAQLVVGDVGDRPILDEVMPGIDAVMHLAGYIEVGESQTRPGRYFDNNVARANIMLEAMVEHGIDAIVFSSTAAVYGEPETVPVLEDAPKRPVNIYGASKLMFEQMLDWYAATKGLRSVRFRYFNVAGAWPDGSLGEAHVPETHIIPRVLGSMASGQSTFEVFGSDYPTQDGTCVRDYIHVMDLARAHQLGLERLGDGKAGGVYNLGSGRGYTNLQVVRTCAEVTGADVAITMGPRRAGDPTTLIASNERAQRELGWTQERGALTDIITNAWAWHSSHPQGYTSTR